LVKDHLYGLDAQRHRFGAHYYRQAGDSVVAAKARGGAVVSITQVGIAQRLFGGTIVPRTAKMLTIPASPEAYGMRAGEFNDLVVRKVVDPQSGALRLALVRSDQVSIKLVKHRKADGSVSISAKPIAQLGGEVMFWLVKSVHQAADPTVLPYTEQMSATASTAIKTRLARLAARQGGDVATGGDN
jgi:hypothetical protein